MTSTPNLGFGLDTRVDGFAWITYAREETGVGIVRADRLVAYSEGITIRKIRLALKRIDATLLLIGGSSPPKSTLEVSDADLNEEVSEL